ncbi:phosphate ABC transporter permease subunit PstC [Virgibacillus sp. 179-BFC.A HS]|uniref:Phosphate transport system permease protein n=1 Tax=Tigheibacillus jepli TaxID=3035914 RepID=A0ABU5CE60_9BACI|nr:phosphate ABC transporter permease subunit PstC [Virgibacillus sp. 179-BFC.A HS]MDY0404291.1 phosphate ABC transporter permease subunit PstC [Virgibacillus sp. 179-BFC.A HS]
MPTVTSASTRLIKKQKHNPERKGRYIVTTCALLIIIATAAIMIFLTQKGLQSFIGNGLSPLEFLTSANWHPISSGNGEPSYGALSFIFGSFAVTILAAIIAAPLGIGAAIFMTEIAPSWGKKVFQPIIELLVGIPSVVYGFIGLSVLVPFLRSSFGGLGFGLLAGMIVLAIMILPTVTSIATDTLHSLPKGLRDASAAIGATRWQTISRILIPAAMPGLLTAVVLGMARAFGEALAVQMVIGNATSIPNSLTEPAATLTTIITLNMGHTTFGSLENNVLWSLALILLLMSLLFIILIRFLSSRRKYE